MGKITWRIFLVVLILAALIPSLAIISQSIVPLLITLVFGALFLLLELPTNTGTTISALQFVVVRISLTSLMLGIAIFLLYVGASEFYTPYIPSRYSRRIYLEAARTLLGPTGVAALFFASGGLFVVYGFNYFRTGTFKLKRKTK